MIHKIDELAKNFKEPTTEQLNNYNTWKCEECGEIILETLENGEFPSPLGVIFSLILHSKNLLLVIVYKSIIV